MTLANRIPASVSGFMEYEKLRRIDQDKAVQALAAGMGLAERVKLEDGKESQPCR